MFDNENIDEKLLKQKIIDQIVQRHDKNEKKFEFHFGSGKQINCHQLGATSLEERESWVNSISEMILIHLQSKTEKIIGGSISTIVASNSLSQNTSKKKKFLGIQWKKKKIEEVEEEYKNTEEVLK